MTVTRCQIDTCFQCVCHFPVVQIAQGAVIESDMSYCIPNLRAAAHLCKTNIPPCTAFRGFGRPQTVAIMETALTHVASHLNMAPERVGVALLQILVSYTNFLGIKTEQSCHFESVYYLSKIVYGLCPLVMLESCCSGYGGGRN